MRKGDDLALVDEDTPVTEAINRMTRARAGAVVVTNAEGLLAGIFTQGDFVRAFEGGNPDIGAKPVGELMTAHPIHVKEDQLVGEVLRTLEESRIDDLIVVNKAGEPVGMIDTQDLTRLQVV